MLQSRLAEVRIKSGLSLRELAEKTGVSIATLNRIENNLLDDVLLSTAYKVASFYGVPIEEMFLFK